MDAIAEQLIARLRSNPDDAEAYAALRAHYRQAGDYASLANLLEGWASRTVDASSAANALYEAAQLISHYQSDPERAAGLLERALERQPLHPEAGTHLEQILEDAQEYRRLVELLDRRASGLAESGADPRSVAAVHLRLGQVWEHALQRPDRAIRHYRQAFELDATLVPAIYAAREIYRNAGNLKTAASLYEQEANAETDAERKVALFRELAHLRAESLRDTKGAIRALEQALAIAPGDVHVMHELASALIHRAEGTSAAAQAEADHRRAADLMYQMAQSLPIDHAIPYAEAALDSVPDHDGALELLERLATEAGRTDMLAVRWVAFIEASPDALGAAPRRRQLGQAYVDAGQLDDAIVCLEPLLDAGDAAAAETLVDLYRSVGRDQDVPRALAVAVQSLPPDDRIPRLREMIDVLVAQGKHDEAVARAKEILEFAPGDDEALQFLETEYRNTEQWSALRELMLSAARVSGASVDARKERLREVARVSSRHLDDPNGAIEAYRAIVALDPADADARDRLAQHLEATQRWDELVEVLDREALAQTDPDGKASVYRRLAAVHKDARQDLEHAIVALMQVRELAPGDDRSRDTLCDALLETARHAEAVPLLRERLEDAVDPGDRIDVLRTLADTLEYHLGDLEAAFGAAAQLLEEEPGDIVTLDRMERIDVRLENPERLLDTLSYRTDVVDVSERPAMLRRMAVIADETLDDLDRAADLYRAALEFDPKDEGTLEALASVYDRAARYEDLVELLQERVQREEVASVRTELHRRIARILAERVGDEDAAADAWREVLDAGDDEEALRALRAHAAHVNAPEELEDYLRRLAVLLEVGDELRDLLIERAEVLAEPLDRPADAVIVLRDVLDRVDPSHVPSMIRMAALCERTEDHAGLADALERQLAINDDDGLRVPLAKRLADLYEGPLEDAELAVVALSVWADTDLTDPIPKRRLATLLERLERYDELVTTLDDLAGIEQDDEVVGALTRRAAELALEQLEDVDGAWSRLVPRVEVDDAEAESRLRLIAQAHGRAEALAEL